MFRVPSDVETTLMEDVIGASASIRILVAKKRSTRQRQLQGGLLHPCECQGLAQFLRLGWFLFLGEPSFRIRRRCQTNYIMLTHGSSTSTS